MAMGSKATPSNEGRNATNPNKSNIAGALENPIHQSSLALFWQENRSISTQLFQTENSQIPKKMHYITAFTCYGLQNR